MIVSFVHVNKVNFLFVKIVYVLHVFQRLLTIAPVDSSFSHICHNPVIQSLTQTACHLASQSTIHPFIKTD
jgi:hypothetical protein